LNDSDSSIVRDVFDKSSAMAALERAVELVGGQSALARAATKHAGGRRLSQKTIWKWLNRARGPVPSAEWAVPIEKAVAEAAARASRSERVTRYELRADVFGVQPKDAQELARA
jgi:hypothetical protein